MPVVWKDAVLHQHGEAPEELQSVGPRRWTKALTGPEWSKKERRVERNSATRTGLSQRSRVVRGVGWEGHVNRCPQVWTELLHEGQEGEAPATPIRAL